MHFHYITYMTTHQHKSTRPECNNYNFGRPLITCLSLLYTLSQLVLSMLNSEEDIFKEIQCNAFSLDLYGQAQAQKSPAQGFMKFTILVDNSLVISTKYLVCLILAACQGVQKNSCHLHFLPWLFLLYTQVVCLIHAPNYLPLWWWVKFPYPRDATYKIWFKLPQQFLRRC